MLGDRQPKDLKEVMAEVRRCYDLALRALQEGRRADAEKWLADARSRAEGLRLKLDRETKG